MFDTEGGDNDIDDAGVELDSDEEAVQNAVRYAGSMIHDQPEILVGGGAFVVSVRRNDGSRVARVRVELHNG